MRFMADAVESADKKRKIEESGASTQGGQAHVPNQELASTSMRKSKQKEFPEIREPAVARMLHHREVQSMVKMLRTMGNGKPKELLKKKLKGESENLKLIPKFQYPKPNLRAEISTSSQRLSPRRPTSAPPPTWRG